MTKTYAAGPFYWSVEHGAEGASVGRAWMAEMNTPYRMGKGVRVRIGSRAFQVGVCKKSPRALVRDVEFTAEDIGKW